MHLFIGNCTKYFSAITLLLQLILFPSLVVYANNPTEWPYGGKSDASRKEPWMDQVPLNFTQPADFTGSTFKGAADFTGSKFKGAADFTGSKFKGNVYFTDSTFKGNVDFRESTFTGNVDFTGLKFTGDAYFSGSTFKGTADFRLLTFPRDAYFTGSKFKGAANFTSSTFTGNVDFRQLTFTRDADFTGSTFKGAADFTESTFKDEVNLKDVRFEKLVDFSGTTFKDGVNLENIKFEKSVNFSGTKFEKGVDLRRTYLEKATILIDHNTFFPNGTFHADWTTLQGRLEINKESFPSFFKLNEKNNEFKFYKLESTKQKTKNTETRLAHIIAQRDSLAMVMTQEQYKLTKIFYERLRDNYLAQNDKNSADAVMYELAEKRLESLSGFSWLVWWIYKWTFGWGYKPWQFLLIGFVIVVLPFSLLWYMRFYHRVAVLMDKSLSDEEKKQLANPEALRQRKRLNIRYTVYKHDDISELIPFFTRLGHALFFSMSVLLSIRFKKEWFDRSDRAFYICVVAEWLLGIVLFILFAILVKSNQFDNVKGLLGF